MDNPSFKVLKQGFQAREGQKEIITKKVTIIQEKIYIFTLVSLSLAFTATCFLTNETMGHYISAFENQKSVYKARSVLGIIDFVPKEIGVRFYSIRPLFKQWFTPENDENDVKESKIFNKLKDFR
uniref:Uncharacterized protein n=1 Tax=Glossina austeni TaxID=7395 RepID=A0A1A9VAK0_GLOAU